MVIVVVVSVTLHPLVVSVAVGEHVCVVTVEPPTVVTVGAHNSVTWRAVRVVEHSSSLVVVSLDVFSSVFVLFSLSSERSFVLEVMSSKVPSTAFTAPEVTSSVIFCNPEVIQVNLPTSPIAPMSPRFTFLAPSPPPPGEDGLPPRPEMTPSRWS